MSESGPYPKLRDPRKGEPITRNEILDVLANEGYSAGSRKNWLKQVLTQLAAEEGDDPGQDGQNLIDEIKKILDQQIPGDPEADDTL